MPLSAFRCLRVASYITKSSALASKKRRVAIYTENLKGAESFALWPLSQAAESCFGKDSWPAEIPVPQAWLEFDDSVEKATEELELQGCRMLVKNKKEPWGQTVSRFITPEGLLVGITFTPSLREET